MSPEPVGSTHLRFGDARVVEICIHDRDGSSVNNQQRDLDTHVGSHMLLDDLIR